MFKALKHLGDLPIITRNEVFTAPRGVAQSWLYMMGGGDSGTEAPRSKPSAMMDNRHNSSMTTSIRHAIPWHCWSSIFTERSRCSEYCWVDFSTHACTPLCVLLRTVGNHEIFHSECQAHSLSQFFSSSWCVGSSLGQSCPY